MPTFVGRRAELDWLAERAAAALDGRPQTVLVQGNVGVGRSALLATFAEQLDPVRVLTASGDEAETFLAFGVLHQMLGVSASTWEDPFVAGAALLQFLDRHAGAPTYFLLDDAHLADPPSLMALTFALRRLQDDRVLAVFGCLEEELARLPAGLHRLVEAQHNRLELEGLSSADVIALAATHGREGLAPRSAERLRQHTGGNPLHLGALLHELPAVALAGGSGQLPAPQSYAALVSGSLGSCSAEARLLARAAAVVTEGSALELVAGVAEVEHPEEAMDELDRARILACRHGEHGWTVRFLHPLTRAVVAADLGPFTRTMLHARAAALLSGDVALLHRVEATVGPDRELAEVLRRRADECSRQGDLHLAADLTLGAARLSAVGTEADERLMDAVNLMVMDGDIAAAKPLAASLEATPPSARRFYLQAKIAWLSGQPRDSETLATRAWERGDELDTHRRGSLAAILAQLFNMRGDGTAAAEWASRALELELPSDLVDSTAAARAFGLSLAGRITEALGLLAGLPSDPVAAGRTHGHQLTARGVLRVAVDDLAGARQDLAAVCGTSYGGLPPHRLVAMGALAEVDYRLGDWDSSLALAEQAVSLAEDSEQTWVLGYLHTTAVLVCAGRGSWEWADHHVDEALRLATELGDPATFAVYANASVHLASCRSEPEEVVSNAALLLGLRGGPTHEPGLLGWPVQYAASLVDLGRLDEAAVEIAGFEALARERRCSSRLAALARVRGELATTSRAHLAGRAAFEEASTLGDGVASALEQALTRAAFGRFLRRRGERRAAIAELQSARGVLTALGAAPFVARCDAELAACGVDTGNPSESAAPTLTPQEQMVARLVCQGLSNQAAAHELVLSVKTVGYHLANVYTKLGIHSRTQLAAVWGDRT